MYVRHWAVAALSPLVIATTSAKFLSARVATPASAPCYAALTAFVADVAPFRVHRIVSTGVRRFVDSRTLVPPACAPADRARADSLRAAVTAQLGKDAGAASWVQIESTDSTVTNDHLARLSRVAAADVERITVHVGADSDLVVLPTRR